MSDSAPRILLTATLCLGNTLVGAQEPHVLSEEVQRTAVKIGLADRLGIEWSEPSSDDIARYIHTLTAADLIAQTRAVKLGKDEPAVEDYELALYSICGFDLPNMPPKPAKLTELEEPFAGAYYSQDQKSRITEAVGDIVLTADGIESARQEVGEALTKEEFYNRFFDFDSLME